MGRRHIEHRLHEAGIASQATIVSEAFTRVLFAALAPVFARYDTQESRLLAGGRSVAELLLPAISHEVRQCLLEFGHTLVVLWPFERTVAEIARDDVVLHLDDLWAPSSDDLWVFSPDVPRFMLLDHEEVLLLGDLP